MRQPTRRSLLSAIIVLGASTACLDVSGVIQPELTILPGAPEGWTSFSQVGGIGTTSTDKKFGTQAAYLSSAGQIFPSNYLLVQYVRADSYRGKRMQLSAWFKPRNVTNAVYSGLWMRIDGPGVIQGFDDMSRRQITGFGDWRKISVVLDVPEDAIGIAFGTQFQAYNTLLVDEMTLVEVSETVNTTNLLGEPQEADRDSVTMVEAYAERPDVPVNMGFEISAPASGAPLGARSSHTGFAYATLTRPTGASASLRDRVRRTMW
jgi:hypothetical protein